MTIALTATLSDGTATVMKTGASLGLQGGGILTDVKIVASADTAVVPSISDANGVVFSMSSSDFTDATGSANQYQKNEANSNFKAIAVQGQLTVTVTAIGSGTVAVTAKVVPTT